VEELARNIDWLEHHINMNGTVVAKTPDVWGEARLTAHRQEFEDVLKQELRSFDKERINGAEFVSDQAFMAFALALNAKALPANVGFPSVTQSASTANANTIDPTSGSTITQKTDFGGPASSFGYPQSFNFKTDVKLEQIEVLDQLANYVNHLHAIRRNNEGPDTADAPGYAMNLVRIPVSILPGQNTKRGHGAEISITAEPYLGPELLPTAFREFVINDLVDQLSVPIAQLINSRPGNSEVEVMAEETLKANVNSNELRERVRARRLDSPRSTNSQERVRQYRADPGVAAAALSDLLNHHFSSSATRRSTFPFPPSQLVDNFGVQGMASILSEITASFREDLINSQVIHVSDLQGYLREEIANAYELLSQESMHGIWDLDAVTPELKLAELVRNRDLHKIECRHSDFDEILTRNGCPKDSVTRSLAWCLYVDSLLLNERLVRDITKTFGNTPNSPPAPTWLPYYGPNPCPEARQAFAEYVKIRWPIHVFALDPIINEQNIADVRSIYRQMQMSVAVAYASGNIGTSAALQALRKLQRDRATIDLKRTAVAFGHGDDTFGWRFTSRFQTPPVEANSKVFFRDLIVGGPTDRQLEAGEILEPGTRECSAIVIMPSFVPHVTFHSRGNWYKLKSPTRTGDSIHDTVQYSRAIKQMEMNAQLCCQCAHLYRDGEIERLLKRVHQLDRKLALQTLECQVPIENSHGGCELLTAGKRELAPELTGWYGAPGYDPTRETTLFLSGDSFNVTQNRLVIGNRSIEGKLLSRQILEVKLPPGLAVMRDRRLDDAEYERFLGYIDAQVATPYGVSGHMLIPVVRPSPTAVQVVTVRPNTIQIQVQLGGTKGADRSTFTVSKFNPVPTMNLLQVEIPRGDGLQQQTSLYAVLFGTKDNDRLIDIAAIQLSTNDGGNSFLAADGELASQFADTTTAGRLGSIFAGHINYLLANGRAPVGKPVKYSLGVGLSTSSEVKSHPLTRAVGAVEIEVILIDPK
jgi:hypothetical protein